MTRFIQLHLLTSYPPANLNRDDLGRPKTAVMGGDKRLRVSSQSLKRAWRTSDVFASALSGHLGTRTKEQGRRVREQLLAGGLSDKQATDWATLIAKQFGKPKSGSVEIEQLAHFSPEEQSAIDALVQTLIERKSAPTEDELKLLRHQHSAADIALFGRMLAAAPSYNTEAAAQVAHAISVHKVAVEDDFFTAVDDLNEGIEDVGAGHMGETEFAAGLFYLYLCIDRELLGTNLGGDQALRDKALAALAEAAATVAPTGKQNSFGSRARASYLLAEKGDQQPRSLSVAFLKSVRGSGEGMLPEAIGALTETLEKMDQVYGPCADDRSVMDALAGTGSLADIQSFIAS
ncbi:type I-E CRISPR-associated protein Cas7/Cse4/CasC [Thiorhodovibrio frisius]|uniref:CRISPR-associated protein Cas7/Cse4/CasC, subtype I-E n=1 Tax=Thiorhodovibrio frisius TaxID=631362 RepID=H8Z8M8_9GAMM|nr:type I-E CRISPR-associated protein Cas7/Cse4/CasC [Thiorhodovibrio frisius]EIC19433.1 CRISPR-associated protein Cas7/Cse4/CasC, subtype I-E [Thiorhodovibrio frisius]WPL22264.1 CRISPR system Cascade subunit CasC [Thiorhodovibrio frisius]